jgi:N-methylhydantoinase A
VIPEVSPALSAAGTILSDLQCDFSETFATDTGDFDFTGVAAVVDRLRARCEEFAPEPTGRTVALSVEARYPQQVWEIEVPLPIGRIEADADVELMRDEFHRVHESIFAISDPGSEVELVQWRARVRVELAADRGLARLRSDPSVAPTERRVRFPDSGPAVAAIHAAATLEPGAAVQGPAIVESAFATVVVEPGGSVTMSPNGSLLLRV